MVVASSIVVANSATESCLLVKSPINYSGKACLVISNKNLACTRETSTTI